MKKFFILLGFSFKCLLLTTFNIGKGTNKKKAASGIAAFLFLCGLMLYISGTYSYMLATVFFELDAIELMLISITGMALFFPFVYMAYASQSLIFSTKDVDFMLSLPVSSFSIMTSRLFALYLESLLMVELILIPAAIFYVSFSGGSIGFILWVLLCGALLAFIPTTMALLFGSLISLVVSKMRFKNLFSLLFNILFLVAILAISFSVSFGVNNITPTAISDLRHIVQENFAFLWWIYLAYIGNIPYFILIAILCVVPFILFTWIFSKFYKNILTRLSSHHLRTDYRLRRIASRSSFWALFSKEASKLFSTPALMLNGGFGVFMAVLAAIACFIFRQDIYNYFALFSIYSGIDTSIFLPFIMLLLSAFFIINTNIVNVSISLEGKYLWILKSAPVSVLKIFMVKIGLNVFLCMFAVFITIPLFSILFAVPLPYILLATIFAFLLSVFISSGGLLINLFLPRLDAENDVIVIKQSASVLVGLLFSLLTFGGLIALWFSLSFLSFVFFTLLCTSILLCLNIATFTLLFTKGRTLFNAL